MLVTKWIPKELLQLSDLIQRAGCECIFWMAFDFITIYGNILRVFL